MNKQNIHTCMNVNKIISKFVAKLLKYRLLFKDILTFLGLDYRDATLTLKTMNLILLGINIKKIR